MASARVSACAEGCLDLMSSEAADGAFYNAIRETIGVHLDYARIHDRVVCLSIQT